jgi:hypothetical protein
MPGRIASAIANPASLKPRILVPPCIVECRQPGAGYCLIIFRTIGRADRQPQAPQAIGSAAELPYMGCFVASHEVTAMTDERDPERRKADRRQGDRRTTKSVDYAGPERRSGERRQRDRRQSD